MSERKYCCKPDIINVIVADQLRQAIQPRRHVPIRAGQLLCLYLRKGRRIHRQLSDVVVKTVDRVIIHEFCLYVDGTMHEDPETLNAFAKADGFKDWSSFADYYGCLYGLPFSGDLIRW